MPNAQPTTTTPPCWFRIVLPIHRLPFLMGSARRDEGRNGRRVPARHSPHTAATEVRRASAC
ncbi:MAG: hypothetical protein ACK52I_03655, partial [Pseudomonadota bacterium]